MLEVNRITMKRVFVKITQLRMTSHTEADDAELPKTAISGL